MMAGNEKLEKYENFLNNVLREDLRLVVEERERLYEDISAHSQLRQTITCITESPNTTRDEGLRTQVDLGSTFTSRHMCQTPSRIFVNIGLGFHVELTLPEALGFIDKKLAILNSKLTESTQKSAKIKGQIKFVYEAIRELHRHQGLIAE